jgi:hypothetical protein
LRVCGAEAGCFVGLSLDREDSAATGGFWEVDAVLLITEYGSFTAAYVRK